MFELLLYARERTFSLTGMFVGGNVQKAPAKKQNELGGESNGEKVEVLVAAAEHTTAMALALFAALSILLFLFPTRRRPLRRKATSRK